MKQDGQRYTDNDKSLCNRAEIIIAFEVVTPPMWERSSWPAGTEDRKRQDKQCRKTGPIKGTSNQVRVVLEYTRAFVSEEVLDEEASAHLAQDDASL